MRTEPVQSGVLVVMDGGLAAFVAAWMEGVCRPVDGGANERRGGRADGGTGGTGLGVHGWFSLQTGTGTRRGEILKRAVQKAATLSGLARLETGRFAQVDPARLSDSRDSAAHQGMDQSVMLLNAAYEARRLGLSRVVWPVQLGGEVPELNAIADVCDRAMLIGQLAGLDAPLEGGGGGEFRIEAPFADLTDVQLAELAIDMDVPVIDLFTPPSRQSIRSDPACWWCEREDPEMCGRCASCVRWRRAFEAAAPGMMRELAQPAARA